MVKMPVIDRNRCDGCGLCVEVCRCQVLVLVDNVVEIREDGKCKLCTRWCTMCEMVCPTGAIQCPFEIIIEE
jgi:MinD superfamily P-loop ATPase